MKVFRLCRENEIQQILDKQSFKDIGRYYSNFGCNEHKYENNKKYLHFFKTKSDLLYLRFLKGKYICEYDIPQNICEKYIGVGRYCDYVNFAELVWIKEIAIPSDLLKFEYLQNVGRIVKNIDFDLMQKNPNLNGYIQKIYGSEMNTEKNM